MQASVAQPQSSLAIVALSGWALLAVGGVYTWAAVPVIAGSLVLAAVSRPPIAASPDTRTLDLALLAVLIGGALQLIPLPARLVTSLAPQAPGILSLLSLDYQPDERLVSVSVDPGATLYGLSLTGAIFVFFWVCRATFHKGGLRRVVRGVAWLGLFVSLVAIVQRATAPELVYWSWTPIDEGARPYGPFVNRNHFATWMIMAIPLLLGYVWVRRGQRGRRRPRRHWMATLVELTNVRAIWLGTAVLIMLLALTVSLSRSGLTGLIVAGTVSLWLLRDRFDRGGHLWLGTSTVLALIVVLSWANLGTFLERLNTAFPEPSGGRLGIWRDTVTMFGDFWLTGTGLGTYPSAMLVYQESNRAFFINHAHNHYLQILAEGGLLVAIPAVVALVAFGRLAVRYVKADRSWRYWLRVGALTGLGAVAIQSIWEGGLRLPANGLLCAILAAVAAHEARGDVVIRRGSGASSEP